MCGIAGIFDSRERREIDEGLLARMTDSLVHRGPDGEGLHISLGIGLGHRRLAIIDLAGGQQPLYNEDRSVAYKETKNPLKENSDGFNTYANQRVSTEERWNWHLL